MTVMIVRGDSYVFRHIRQIQFRFLQLRMEILFRCLLLLRLVLWL